MRCTDKEFFEELSSGLVELGEVLKTDCSCRDLKEICFLHNKILNCIIQICEEQQYRIERLEKVKSTIPFTKSEIDKMQHTIELILLDDDVLPSSIYEWKEWVQEYGADVSGLLFEKLEMNDIDVLQVIQKLIYEAINKNVKDTNQAIEILETAQIL